MALGAATDEALGERRRIGRQHGVDGVGGHPVGGESIVGGESSAGTEPMTGGESFAGVEPVAGGESFAGVEPVADGPDEPVGVAAGPSDPGATESHVIGITGPPGGGKSTLVDALIDDRRAKGQRVAVIAVDPSSLVTGGAVLGDRVRMNAHATDDGVFIRSIATRGHLGGVTAATFDVVDLCSLAGWQTIIIETVGVGQSEIEIARIADTTIVVANPGQGDAVQARKAGLFEIGDVFVLNKADRPGARRAASDLREMLHGRGDGTVPVLETVASQYADGGRAGVAELNAWLDDRWTGLCSGDELAAVRAHRSIARVDSLVAVAAEQAQAAALASARARGVRDRVESGLLGVHAGADQIAALFLRPADPTEPV